MSSAPTFPVWDHIRASVPALREEPDAWVRRMMRWHFSDETGSPFWLSQVPELGFDPLRDVQGLESLRLFGLFDVDRLRTVAVRELVPRGFANRPRRIFETGGTTGAPCRVPDVVNGPSLVEIYRAMLETRGLGNLDMIAMTPTGPHAYGTFVARLANSGSGMAFFVDFDPRWVKQLVRAGQSTRPYVRHLVDQTLRLLESQRPALLFTTSKLLIEIASELGTPLKEAGLRAVCTGGTSCTPEEEQYLRANYLDEVCWIDTYGNTLMGHALQGDALPGECERRSYHLPPPLGFIEIVDPDDWTQVVPRDERGRVLIHTLLEDLLIPNLLERDSAVRCGPHPWFPWDGLRDVRPFLSAVDVGPVEGVY